MVDLSKQGVMFMSHTYVTVADANAMARGPTSSDMSLKRTIAAIAAASMCVASFTVAANGGLTDAEGKIIGKQSATVAAAKNQLVAGDRDGGYDKKMTVGQPELAEPKMTTEKHNRANLRRITAEADATSLACLKKIGNAMRKVTRHLSTGGAVALAISTVSA